jgi:hypothetical protein
LQNYSSKGHNMDALTNYLRITRDAGKQPSEAGFNAYKTEPGPQRTTDPLAHHPNYTDADGNPFGVAGTTTTEDVRRRRDVERANALRARPVPKSYGLGSGSPKELVAAGKHGQEIAERIRQEQTA